MSLKSNQEWTGLIVCKDATGALSTPSAGPIGALYVNGELNGASVTVSGSGPYKWTVTLPTLSPGDLVSMYITATIDGVATAEVVAEDVADTYRTSDIAAAVWDRLTSALTTAGSVGAYLLSKLGLLTAATSVTVASPISGGTVTTVQGDDYKAEDGRAIEWVVSTPVDLTGGTVQVVLSGVATYTGSVVGADTIRLELTAAQTAAIPVGLHRYQVIHTQSVALGEDVTTLVDGTWTSARRYTE